ncbi:MAG: alpha/beta fold hydrolase [Acidobacteriaceae bacterium]
MPRSTSFLTFLCLAVTLSPLSAQNLPVAIATDPPANSHPTSNVEIAVPSHGEQLYGIFYLAAGEAPHPTVLLLHGFPGYEQQLDLAQALRRAGWNVLAVHYRGSWGVHGNFSFTHCMEDADAEVAFLLRPEIAAKYRIDTKDIVVIGHSMGGYMAASATAHNPTVRAVVMIGAWDIGSSIPRGITDKIEILRKLPAWEGMEDADFLPLSGCTPQSLALEIYEHRNEWDFIHFAPTLATRPALILTADDGSDPDNTRLLAALKATGDKRAEKIYTKTDHGFSNRRIYMESLILNWLAALPAH